MPPADAPITTTRLAIMGVPEFAGPFDLLYYEARNTRHHEARSTRRSE